MEIGAKIDLTALPVISYLELCLCLLIKKSQVAPTKLIPTYVPYCLLSSVTEKFPQNES